jgi:hypothetical protein
VFYIDDYLTVKNNEEIYGVLSMKPNKRNTVSGRTHASLLRVPQTVLSCSGVLLLCMLFRLILLSTDAGRGSSRYL